MSVSNILNQSQPSVFQDAQIFLNSAKMQKLNSLYWFTQYETTRKEHISMP